LGRGNWQSSSSKCIDALEWVKAPWERSKSDGSGSTKSITVNTEDSVIPGNEVYCGSSTDLTFLGQKSFDLVITDPPFGNNYYYADLSDFFYVWLRIPLRKWYTDLPEQQYFDSERTPHSMEAIDNPAEHPDYRKDYEKSQFIDAKHLNRIQEITGDISLAEKDPNPLYQPEPSSDFYCQTLSACWAEASNCLKDGGIMAFTFHHNDDEAWIDVLKALFNAGYVLLQTFPVIGDESKGEKASFGSKKIEYDVIHVCRKRLEDPEPVSWARMRRWVKEEALHLKELLEHTHGKELPESDLRVILRGKSLEFYSRHYGKVFTGNSQLLDVQDALLGINQLLDDLLDDSTQKESLRPPDSAYPSSYLYMRLFKNRTEMDRDELHKMLRGYGISQDDLEARGWIHVVGRTVHAVSISDRFSFFTGRCRNRKVIKTDLDQAHFLIGAALPKSGLKIDVELNNPNFRIEKSVDDILEWYSAVDQDPEIKRASMIARQLVEQWRKRKDRPQGQQSTLLDHLEEND
jgi:putative DNA methylase